MLGGERFVVHGRDDEPMTKTLGVHERHALVVAHGGRREALLPEVERRLGAHTPLNRVDHPGPGAPGAGTGILEERDVAPRPPVLVGVEEVVDGRVVLVHGLLHEPQAEDARVEVDVPRRIAGDAGDVVDAVETHCAQRSRPSLGSPREDRDRRPVLVVVLGCGRRARGAAGSGARGARPRRAPGDGQRPAGPVHPGPAPSRRAPRRASGQRDPGGALGDRARERLAPEHRPLAALVLPDGARARARALRRAPSARADDADDLPDRPHPRTLPARRDVPRVGRSRVDEGTAYHCGASSSTGSTIGSRSPSARRSPRTAGCPGSTRSSRTASSSRPRPGRRP